MAGVQKGYGGLLAAEGRLGGRRTEGLDSMGDQVCVILVPTSRSQPDNI